MSIAMGFCGTTGKLAEAQYKWQLQRNDEFDLIKIGFAEDGIFYLRADLYRSTAINATLKRLIYLGDKYYQ